MQCPRASLILLVVGAAAACSGTGSDAPSREATADSAAVARARLAADELGRDLMGLLTAELRRGGPDAAIAVCADSAQLRTARHAAEGLAVRRVGTRVRNPANTPDSIEAGVLDVFERALAAGRTPADTGFVTRDAAGRPELRYLRPVRVAEPCLNCHGARGAQTPAVRALLAKRYPDDEAVNYRVGDLRGAVSVRLRLDP